MLVDGLCAVLGGHPSLANFTLPYMIEQIGNPSEPDARLHALQCLCTLYGSKSTYTHGHTSSSNYRELAEVLFELACDSAAPSAMAAATADKAQAQACTECLFRLIRVLCLNLALSYSKKCGHSHKAHEEGEGGSCGQQKEGWTHFGEYLLKLCVEALGARANPLDSQSSAKVVQLCAVVGSSCDQCFDAVHRAITGPLLIPVCVTTLSSLATGTHASSDETTATINTCCAALTHIVTLLRCRQESRAPLAGLSFSNAPAEPELHRTEDGDGARLQQLWAASVTIIIEHSTASSQPPGFSLTTSKTALRLYRDVLTCVLELIFR
jgi:hypothetical protein